MKILNLLITILLTIGMRTMASANNAQEFTVIDVRTDDEYSESHVKGALHIDIKSANFEEQILKLDKNKSYKLYCRSGNRSGKALEFMKGKGFQHLENLGGLGDAIQKLHGVCEGKKPC